MFRSFLKFFMSTKKDVTGEIVLVTGASSGIGQGLCVELAKRGCTVVGWGRSQAGLEHTRQLIEEVSPETEYHSYVCDVTKREMVYQVANKVKNDVGNVNILINNAGIVTGKKLLDCPDDLLQKTLDTNTGSHFWTLKAFLPNMLKENHGHIVTISSAGGLFGIPGLVDYCASKHGAVGLTEALQLELIHTNKTGVKVTCVCPAFIDTGMFDGITDDKMIPIMDKNYAVSRIVSGILTDEYFVVLPKIVTFYTYFKGMIPIRILAAYLGLTGARGCMDTFKGHRAIVKNMSSLN